MAEALQARHVVLIPDNDAAGRKAMQRIAADCQPLAASLRWLELPGLPDKGDVTDFLKDHSLAVLWELVRSAPSWFPPVHSVQSTPQSLGRGVDRTESPGRLLAETKTLDEHLVQGESVAWVWSQVI